jgi:hypothetical protein
MVTMWLDAISAPFFMLRSTITASQRDQAKDDFKDRVANCNVLVATYAVAAHGLSLQNAFVRVVAPKAGPQSDNAAPGSSSSS